MAFKPNEEQQLFIDTKDKNVLVSASAGSGKTTTMVHKLVDIICNDRVSVSKLLIVTYTNAAANEMKQKIYNAMLNKLKEVEDESLQEFLYQELESINVADIGTLHSVCKKIISKYFYKIHLNPSFSLIMDKEQEYLFASVMDKVIKKRILNLNDSFYTLYDNFSQKRNMHAMYSVILKLYTFLITKPNHKDWVDKMLDASYDKVENNICGTFLLNYYKDILSHENIVLETALVEATSGGFDKFVDYIKSLMCFISEFCACETYFDSVKLVTNYAFMSKPTVRNDSKDVDLVAYNEEVTPIIESFRNVINKEIKKYFQVDSLDDLDLILSNTKTVVKDLICVV
ncbi:MAG: UvrD-helicase domain-containing protein, partial [Clostridia bacterium]|nr:UvrD-helicase domain-containing protein [Clostridia bacterium]